MTRTRVNSDMAPALGQREVCDDKNTVGEMCLKAMDLMMHRESTEQSITVLHEGAIYYFNVECVGVKPPYTLNPTVDCPTWFGMREN